MKEYLRLFATLFVLLLPVILDAQTRKVVTSNGEINLKIVKGEYLLNLINDNMVDFSIISGNAMYIKNSVFESVKLLKATKDATLDQILEIFEKIKFSSLYSSVGAILEYRDGTRQGIRNRISVRLKPGVGRSAFDGALRDYGIDSVILNKYDSLTYTIQLSKSNSLDALDVSNALQKTGLFEYSNVLWLRFLKPHTAAVSKSAIWQNDADLSSVWAESTGQGIKVAVLDDGVQLDHPDLKANLLPGLDAADGDGDTRGGQARNDTHGTACAGIIAAVKNNIGGQGIAYDCKIIPVRIGFGAGTGGIVGVDDEKAGDAIQWAVQTAKADVLSCSWGGGLEAGNITVALKNAIANGRGGKGTLVVFSSGNENYTRLSYPASLPGVIAVGASTLCNTRKRGASDPAGVSCDSEYNWGSTYGEGLSVVAQGIKVRTTDLTGSRGYAADDYYPGFNGTSAACPQVAGILALILSKNPNLTANQARAILEGNADKLPSYIFASNSAYPNGTWNKELGYGRANATRALSRMLNFSTPGNKLVNQSH